MTRRSIRPVLLSLLKRTSVKGRKRLTKKSPIERVDKIELI